MPLYAVTQVLSQQSMFQVNVGFLAMVLRVIYKTKKHQQSINKSITSEKMGSNLQLAVVK